MAEKVTRLAVLGSTGSIGRQTLDVVRSLPERFRIVGLAAGQNLKLLEQQIEEFKPAFVSHNGGVSLPKTVGANYRILPPEAIVNLPQVDIAVIAASGKAGLVPALAAIRAGKTVALANKEALVMAGEILTAEAKQHNARILPIDSEHSAIWQCLNGENSPPSGIILTASGGPFRGFSKDQLDKVTPAQALKHPSWKMGKKITIDSATLMNKGLEVIEARWLFDMPFDKIRVLIHPQSIIHSMVEFPDGSVKAQLSQPDMRLPIQYALSYPERIANPKLPVINWAKLDNLAFEPPNTRAFPCLKLAIEAGKHGGTYPAALCAADEAAVELFLAGTIKFTDIARLVGRVLDKHKSTNHPSLEEILEADVHASGEVRELGKGRK